MGLPTAAQIHRHDQFFQQYMVALASVALAGHELYGRGAVIVNEVDQTMRYQGGGRWAVRGRRWQRERLWVTRYDPDQQMIIIINNLEGNHSSYFLGLPVTRQELIQEMEEMSLETDSRAMIQRLLGQSGR